MEKIKKSIETIAVPKNLHEAAYAKLPKRKRSRPTLALIALFVLTFCSVPIVLSHYMSIPDFFSQKEEQLANIDEHAVLVEGPMFNITTRAFIDYKENVKLVHMLNNIPFQLEDKELLTTLIKDRLLLYEAQQANVHVTEEEVMQYALQTKEAYLTAEDDTFTQLLEASAKQKGVAIEDYFTHPEVLQQYEELLITNVFTERYETSEHVEAFKNTLYARYAKDLHIDDEQLQALSTYEER